MNEVKKIEGYFQKTAEDFDSIYSEGKNIWRRFIDFIFRRSMHERFELTFQECGYIQGKSVLDIGSGSGRYSIEFAKRRAKSVVGIDFSENMLKLAGNLAERNKVSQICRFIKADFLSYNFQDNFDICIAIGVLEYFSNSGIYLEKIKSVANGKIIISLPVLWTFRSLLRKIRLTLKACPVYFYTKKKIKELLRSKHLENYKIIRLDRDYLVVISLQ
ncbi:MAG: class I SAM-dependent methyltransferase [Candidatus Omnitrophica bacterium]|nr:class I SAM-dependent methyltransferase [Candidatus Omnitrophota bacterium]